MSDDKKPKIDLKARLGKAGASVPSPSLTPPPPPGRVSAPPPILQSNTVPSIIPAPGPAVGVPQAVAGPAQGALAQAMMQRSAPQVAAPPPEARRIEIDDSAMQESNKGAFKKGLMAGGVLAVVLAAVGFLGGSAKESGSAREKSITDANELAADLAKAQESLKTLSDKLDAGRNALVKDKKFPADLARDLGGISVAFDGTELAGRRFSGFSKDTTQGLVNYVTAVQSINDRKSAIADLLNKLKTPLTEQFNSAGKTSIQHVVLLGRSDESRNNYAILAKLNTPITVTPPNVALPGEFQFTDPLSNQKSSVDKYVKGDLSKASAVYVLPKSFEASCPSATAGEAAQLASLIQRVLGDINGDKGNPDIGIEPKKGLIDVGKKLEEGLKAVK